MSSRLISSPVDLISFDTCKGPACSTRQVLFLQFSVAARSFKCSFQLIFTTAHGTKKARGATSRILPTAGLSIEDTRVRVKKTHKLSKFPVKRKKLPGGMPASKRRKQASWPGESSCLSFLPYAFVRVLR